MQGLTPNGWKQEKGVGVIGGHESMVLFKGLHHLKLIWDYVLWCLN